MSCEFAQCNMGPRQTIIANFLQAMAALCKGRTSWAKIFATISGHDPRSLLHGYRGGCIFLCTERRYAGQV